jgi:hypothetical protein
MKRPTVFFCNSTRVQKQRSLCPIPSAIRGQCGSMSLLFILLWTSLCVAGRSCLSELTGSGGDEPNKINAKKAEPFHIMYLYFMAIPRYIL